MHNDEGKTFVGVFLTEFQLNVFSVDSINLQGLLSTITSEDFLKCFLSYFN